MSAVRRLLVRNRRAWAVARDTLGGVWELGFTHAGNLAYLSLLTLFPFFIIVATVAGVLGRTEDGLLAIRSFMQTMPPSVGALVERPIADVLNARASSGLLTLGILVTLWTVTSFTETIRTIIREAYGAEALLPLWRYRALSLLGIFVAVILMLAALAAQVLLTGIETFVDSLLPPRIQSAAELGVGRLVPAAVLFSGLYLMFFSLTPKRFRLGGYWLWPGALATTAVWIGTTMGMPFVLGQLSAYSLTYGSLAGVIVTLLFFWIIGLGLVFGAHFNAALAKARQRRLKTGKRPLDAAQTGLAGDIWPD